MKKPPSANVSPPSQTTQRVPTRSSKPGEAGGSGGGIAGAAAGACSEASSGTDGGASCSGAVASIGGATVALSDAPTGSGTRGATSGGGIGCARHPLASSASSRARKVAA